MKIYRPKSLLSLVLCSFALVVLPLLIALASAEYFMEQLADQSAQAVYRATTGSKNSRILLEQIRSQERKALLFDALGDSGLFRELEELHNQIQTTIKEQISLLADPAQKERLHLLQVQENHLFTTFQANPENDKLRQEALKKYKILNQLANAINGESGKLMIQETENLHAAVNEAQKNLLWQASFLIFFSISLITLFALLIIRPIRQIDQSILRLGEGDFVTPVHVSGPRDLEFIGKQLNWLKDRLAELDQEKIKFVAHVSHELKTPLAALREGAGLLEEEVVGPLTEEQKEVIQIISNNSIKLQKLIENILNYNVARARKSTIRPHNFNLTTLIKKVTDEHKPMILKNSIRLECPSEPLHIVADQDQIQTVIDNLLSNSLKYTPIEGNICITTKKQKHHVMIEIIDSGPGIKAEERNKIFSAFYQGQAPNYSSIKGSGLGLAIVKEYVYDHQGTIEVIADSRDGAHFRIILPQVKQ